MKSRPSKQKIKLMESILVERRPGDEVYALNTKSGTVFPLTDLAAKVVQTLSEAGEEGADVAELFRLSLKGKTPRVVLYRILSELSTVGVIEGFTPPASPLSGIIPAGAIISASMFIAGGALASCGPGNNCTTVCTNAGYPWGACDSGLGVFGGQSTLCDCNPLPSSLALSR